METTLRIDGRYVKLCLLFKLLFIVETVCSLVCLPVSVVIHPVRAVVNVALTIPPAVVGGGATLTCSWTNLANVRTVEYKLSSTNEVVYTYNTASNTNVGSGILSGSVGWMETDTFIVFIDVTLHSQFVAYECHVTNDEGSYQSSSSKLDIAGK